MKLQILVPQYNEDESIIKNLLDSIAIQQNVNFQEISIIICNDGSEVILDEKFLKKYPFNIEYYKEPHRGIAGTRNACLKYSNAKYVMFCDADDMFLNNCGLSLIMNEINRGFDVLYSYFVGEFRNKQTSNIEYVNYQKLTHFIHGKVYSREFLNENNIKWNEDLKYHEDYYFNSLCFALSGNTWLCPHLIYLWKSSKTSVSRTPFFPERTYVYLLKTHDALITELLKRGLIEQAKKALSVAIIDGYVTLSSAEPSSELYEQRINCFKEFYKKYSPMWNVVTIKNKLQVLCDQIEGLSDDQIIDMETWFKQL